MRFSVDGGEIGLKKDSRVRFAMARVWVRICVDAFYESKDR
jgi:hypothetical protein